MVDKKPILDSIIAGAQDYSTLLYKRFRLKSDAFAFKKEYVVSFYKTNFLHLTGVRTKLRPERFFEMALNEQLTEGDFEVVSMEDPLLLTHVKMKMVNISKLHSLMSNLVDVQERMRRGKIMCVIGTTNGKFTVCFTGKNELVPMSLLYGDMLDERNAIIKGLRFEILKG